MPTPAAKRVVVERGIVLGSREAAVISVVYGMTAHTSGEAIPVGARALSC